MDLAGLGGLGKKDSYNTEIPSLSVRDDRNADGNNTWIPSCAEHTRDDKREGITSVALSCHAEDNRSISAGSVSTNGTNCLTLAQEHTESAKSYGLRINTAAATSSVNGGVLQITSGTYTMKSGTISGITANNGGAIYVGNGGKFILDGGTIENCSALNGGAIYVDAGGSLEIKSGSITNCSATERGGAIYAKTTGDITIDNVPITGCSAKRGGAIYNLTANKIVLSDSQITGCSAENGSAIYLNRGNLELIESLVFNCQAIGTGLGTIKVDNDSQINIERTNIYGNTAYNGGAIYLSENSAVNLSDCSLYSNKAANNGGAIYATDSSTINFSDGEDVYLRENVASNRGGGIFVASATLNLPTGNLIGNSTEYADRYGSAIATNSWGTPEIFLGANLKIDGAGSTGGCALLINTKIADRSQILCSIENSKVAVAFANSGEATLGAKISNCTTGVWIDDYAKATLDANCTIEGATAGVNIDNSNSVLTISGATITGCLYAVDKSTGEVSTKTNIIINSGTFVGKGSGAALYTSNLQVQIKGGSFSNFGYGISMGLNSKVELSGGHIYNNVYYGVYLSSSGGLTMTGGTIGNADITSAPTSAAAASNKAGGVYCTGFNATVKLLGGTIAGNYASSGGGVHIDGQTSSLLIDGCTITKNNSTYGGGVYVADAAFTINSGTISSNQAQNGGGIYLYDQYETSYITGGRITGNTATANGGGVYVGNKHTTNIGGSAYISSNTSTATYGFAGGVYVTSSATAIVSGAAQITNNAADYGAGITIWSSATCTINSGYIQNNNARIASVEEVYNNGTLNLYASATITSAGGCIECAGGTFNFNGNANLASSGSYQIYLQQPAYINVNCSLTKSYYVYKANIQNYDTAGDVAGARVAYSSNSTYLSSAKTYLSVSNMTSGCSLNSDRKANYLVASYTTNQTYVRTRYSIYETASVGGGSYSSYGGTVYIGDASTTSYTSKTYTYGRSFTISAANNSSFDFVGWYTTTSLSGTSFTLYSTNASINLTQTGGTRYFVAFFRGKSNSTISARYGPNFVNAENATIGTTGGTISIGSRSLNTSDGSITLPLSATAASGYTFDGWWSLYGYRAYNTSASFTYTLGYHSNLVALFKKSSGLSNGAITINGREWDYDMDNDYYNFNESYSSGTISSTHQLKYVTIRIGSSNRTSFGNQGTYSGGTTITITTPWGTNGEGYSTEYKVYINGQRIMNYEVSSGKYTYTFKVDGAINIVIEYDSNYWDYH